jgi:hypothetical protein
VEEGTGEIKRGRDARAEANLDLRRMGWTKKSATRRRARHPAPAASCSRSRRCSWLSRPPRANPPPPALWVGRAAKTMVEWIRAPTGTEQGGGNDGRRRWISGLGGVTQSGRGCLSPSCQFLASLPTDTDGQAARKLIVVNTFSLITLVLGLHFK